MLLLPKYKLPFYAQWRKERIPKSLKFGKKAEHSTLPRCLVFKRSSVQLLMGSDRWHPESEGFRLNLDSNGFHQRERSCFPIAGVVASHSPQLGTCPSHKVTDWKSIASLPLKFDSIQSVMGDVEQQHGAPWNAQIYTILILRGSKSLRWLSEPCSCWKCPCYKELENIPK